MSKIICIDGIPGSGVKFQIGMLSNHFKDLGFNVLINKITDEQTFEEAFNKSIHFDGIVLNEGSFGALVAKQIINGGNFSNLNLDKSQRYHEMLTHAHKVFNIVLVTEDIEYCKQRVLDLESVGQDITLELDDYYSKYMNIISNLGNYMLTINLKFNTIDFTSKTSFLQIQKIILDIVK
jgi:hypothetical protein